MDWIPGTIVEGQGVASGKNPVEGGVRGTIRAQRPFFRDAGVAIERLHDGTINVDISPYEFRPIKSSLTLPNVRWHATWAPETFSLFACTLRIFEHDFTGYVYYPHPETKPVKFPGHHMAEIWTEYIEGVCYGQRVMLGADPELLSVSRKD